MRTTSFKSVLQAVASRYGMDPTVNLQQNVADNIAVLLGEKLRWAWDYYPWPETLTVERRAFRDSYASGTAYSAGDEVYHLDSDDYYIALTSTTGNAPATVSEAGAVTVDYAHWCPARASYSGDNYAAATTYAAGDIVFYYPTRSHYCCHSATTGNAPTDTTYWGALAEFQPYIAWEQTGQTRIHTVHGVHRSDPRVAAPYTISSWTADATGIRFTAPEVTRPWITFQGRPPEVTATPYAAATAYAADDIVYYATTGECYRALTSTTGNAPTDTTYWSRVDLPTILCPFAIRSAYADLLRGDGEGAVADREESAAQRLLEREIDIAETIHQQTRQIHLRN